MIQDDHFSQADGTATMVQVLWVRYLPTSQRPTDRSSFSSPPLPPAPNTPQRAVRQTHTCHTRELSDESYESQTEPLSESDEPATQPHVTSWLANQLNPLHPAPPQTALNYTDTAQLNTLCQRCYGSWAWNRNTAAACVCASLVAVSQDLSLFSTHLYQVQLT